jgi:hypothetical protein
MLWASECINPCSENSIVGRKETSVLMLRIAVCRLLLLSVLIVASNVRQAMSLYPPATEWYKVYGSIENEDVARSLVQTSDGGYAMLGYTRYHPVGWVYTSDFWLVKTDSAGNVEWDRVYGVPGYAVQESGMSIVQTDDGGYALAGYTGDLNVLESYDFWLVKTDSAGNMEWNQTYGGADADFAHAVIWTSDGGYAIAGYTRSYGAGGFDFWLIKTDSAGNMQWNKTYGGTGSEHAFSAIQTSDGGYVMAGSTTSSGAGYYDFWLVKVDSAGGMQWNRTYGGIDFDRAYSVIQDSDEGYVIAGSTNSFGAGEEDSWLVKTDSTGNAQWNHTYGGTGADWAYSVAQSGDGGYTMGGSTYSYGAGYGDLWLVKTDSAGSIRWNQTYGQDGSDNGYDVIQTSDEGYAIVGDSNYHINATFAVIDALLVKVCLGDVNGDGLVNIIDLTLIAFAYGSLEGEPDYNPDADLNCDGIVDMQDLVKAARNLGKTS